MKDSRRCELWGHRLEFAAVLVAALAAFWQAGFSDWWRDQLGEWQFYIQEEVNLSLLYSVQRAAEIESVSDPRLRADLLQKMREDTARTVGKIIDERTKRQTEIKKGQAALFFHIRDGFLIIAAMLFAVGKWLSLAAARSRIRNNAALSGSV